jgi:RTX calcium-binding nonapeptide repeat (4 copies)
MGRLGIVVWMVVVVASSASAIALAAGEHGTDHADKLVGTKGGDVLKGLRGHDVLIGGKGADVLIGGKGPDTLRGGRGRDGFNMRDGVQLAAPGRDKIDARDGGNDEINCGAGNDVAIVDGTEDGVYDCEVVREPKP